MPRSGPHDGALWPGARSAEYRLTAKWGRGESASAGEPEWLGRPQAAPPWSSQDIAGDVVRLDPSASDEAQSPDLAGPGADKLRLQRLQNAALLLQQRRGATAKEEQHQQKSPSTARLQQLQGAAMRLRAARSTESQATDGHAMPKAQRQGQLAVSAADTARPSGHALTSVPAADAGPARQNLIQDHLDGDGFTWPAEAAALASREGPINSAESSAVMTPAASALTSLQAPPPPPPPPPKSPAELRRICQKARQDGLVSSMMPDSEIIRTMKLLTVAAALAVLGSESHAVLC